MSFNSIINSAVKIISLFQYHPGPVWAPRLSPALAQAWLSDPASQISLGFLGSGLPAPFFSPTMTLTSSPTPARFPLSQQWLQPGAGGTFPRAPPILSHLLAAKSPSSPSHWPLPAFPGKKIPSLLLLFQIPSRTCVLFPVCERRH